MKGEGGNAEHMESFWTQYGTPHYSFIRSQTLIIDEKLPSIKDIPTLLSSSSFIIMTSSSSSSVKKTKVFNILLKPILF